MKKVLIIILFLTAFLFADTKYFLPIPIQQSNGRPINAANVDLYTTGTSTKVYDLVYLDNSAGAYYYTSAFATAVYDIYVNGTLWKSGISLGEMVSTGDVAGLITAFANDSLTASNGVVYEGRNFSADTTFLTTQTYTDSADAARFTLLDNKYKVNLKQLVWELNASRLVWNIDTVARDSFNCITSGLDTVYFDIPTFYLGRPDTLQIDSVWIYTSGDGATTIDGFRIIANVWGSDSTIYNKVYANTPSGNYILKNSPETTFIVNYPIQFVVFLNVDTKFTFYHIRIFYTWFLFRAIDESNPPPPEE